jgi:Leucine-rich repeat (LRR) protein
MYDSDDMDGSFGSKMQHVRDKMLYCMKRYSCIIFVVLIIIVVTLTVSLIVTSRTKTIGTTTDTISPNFAGTDRFESIVQFLSDRGVTSQEDLLAHNGQYSSTPQNAAVNWIAGTDTLQYEISNPRLIQRYVLAVFFFATGGSLNDSSSSSSDRSADPKPWTRALKFLAFEDECGWSNVVAVPTYKNEMVNIGVSCNTDLFVTSLFVPGNNLVGTIPSELAYLPQLGLLGLHSNALTGSLPSTLEMLHKLLYVNLNDNRLSGSIPIYVGNWNNIEVLALESNAFNGTVPVSVGTAAQLKTVAFSNNQLYGSIEFVRHLAALEYLYLSHNEFTGNLEETFFYNIANVREFDVSHNELSGQFPLATMLLKGKNLHTIDIAHNNFTGSFPTGIISQNFALHYLNVRNNQMTGTIPTTINMFVQLQHLDIAHNHFTGPVPNSLGRCEALEYLFVGHNQFDTADDSLPPLSELVQLRELSLSGLGMSGSIPGWLQYLTNLEMLDLSDNALTGAIPTKVWSLPRLYYLILNDNNITGPLPSTGGEQLSFFSVHHNQIVDDAFDTAVCRDNGTNRASVDTGGPGILVSVDCNAGCTQACCGDCCPLPTSSDSSNSCDDDLIAGYTDGLDHVAAPLAFDPSILSEAQFDAFDMASGDLDP